MKKHHTSLSIKEGIMLVQSRLDEDGAFFNGPLEAKHNNNNKPHLSLANLGGGARENFLNGCKESFSLNSFLKGEIRGWGLMGSAYLT